MGVYSTPNDAFTPRTSGIYGLMSGLRFTCLAYSLARLKPCACDVVAHADNAAIIVLKIFTVISFVVARLASIMCVLEKRVGIKEQGG